MVCGVSVFRGIGIVSEGLDTLQLLNTNGSSGSIIALTRLSTSFLMLSRIPLMNCGDSCALNRRAISIASLMTTVFGVSASLDEFLSGQSQEIAIDNGHTIQPPVFGVTPDQFVDPFDIRDCARCQMLRQRRVCLRARPGFPRTSD